MVFNLRTNALVGKIKNSVICGYCTTLVCISKPCLVLQAIAALHSRNDTLESHCQQAEAKCASLDAALQEAQQDGTGIPQLKKVSETLISL